MADDRKAPTSAFISLDEGGSARPPRPPASRRRVIAAVAALACVALIVGSLGFVHPGADGGWSLDWLFQTTAEEVSATGSAQGDAAGAAANAAADTQGAADGAAVDGTAASSSSAQSAGNAGTRSDASSDGSGGTGGAAAGASGGASSDASSNGSGTSDTTPQQPATITVRVSVDSSEVGSPVSASATVKLETGATAFDALKALDVSYNVQPSQFGIYVSSIGGLAEKEHGSTSGWVYYVNGSFANTSASNYALADGDTVQWVYSVSE
ncbi:DUF4430 domain-containing protein [uncultured Enorma sp.]|uniref:DUF4430 domain-containing protein n=1 Tax=uncultured Enorma sp. TaxID=1714346 RepID=UPI0025991F9D|nr:DUF4430 domain-containing protein [uncultured Enorma sp.]